MDKEPRIQPQPQGNRPNHAIAVSVVLLALVGIPAALIFQQEVARGELRKQALQMAEERSHWGEIFARHLNQKLHDSLFPPGTPYAASSSTRRIEPGDKVFRSWADLVAFNAEALQIMEVNPSATADDIDASRARIARLTEEYREAGKMWEIPSGTVVDVEGYLDKSGRSTRPMVNGEWMNAADGDLLFAKIGWGGKEGYMALYRAQ